MIVNLRASWASVALFALLAGVFLSGCVAQVGGDVCANDFRACVQLCSPDANGACTARCNDAHEKCVKAFNPTPSAPTILPTPAPTLPLTFYPCGWCGFSCLRVAPGMMCPEVPQPADKQCVEESGACIIIPRETPAPSVFDPTPGPFVASDGSCQDSDGQEMIPAPSGTPEQYVWASQFTVKGTSVNINGTVFTDSCDANGNLIEYQCTRNVMMGRACQQLPDGSWDCPQKTPGDYVLTPVSVNCNGQCRDATCPYPLPTPTPSPAPSSTVSGGNYCQTHPEQCQPT